MRLSASLIIAQTVMMMSPNVTSELDVTMAPLKNDQEELLAGETVTRVNNNFTDGLDSVMRKYLDQHGQRTSRRAKRSITDLDRQVILDLHNKLRSQVSPSASNMEYMTWDDELERSSEDWALGCQWEHGPAYLLPSIGQNLGAHWGRYRPPTFHVQAWYDEVRDYMYPYPQECNPWCPYRCVGPVCTHYTQVVWATSNKVGCAINLCTNMNIWGQIWEKAIYLVCNYSPKGNWWGHAPYKHGPPCSACPPSYGGGCRDNLCYKADGTDHHYSPSEPEEETNEVERQQTGTRTHSKARTQTLSWCLVKLNSVINAREQLAIGMNAQQVVCTVQEKSLEHCIMKCKYRAANSFTISKVTVQSANCETRGHQMCTFKKPASHCPRIYCPRNCMQENPHLARVIGTHIYSDRSSICRAAVHAGVIHNHEGGYVDVMPVDKKKHYVGSYQNGIFSESLKNPPGAKAFRIFAVI
ncbi:hypothetical protein chiPu_0004778 [Chiloscyllium punctatum]|uniref:LCCL domain-containing protein n=1 Tax=Chiloscyllium punctatum TaxID=137246 RepID=A0A401S7J1_CHIPU|nr:hypothetical protein [Chiloscyllium punctatum]